MAVMTIKGKKYYPVASWYRCQHVFYNAVDRAWCRLYDARDNGTAEEEEEAEEWLAKAEDMQQKFDSNPKDAKGVVYALYDDYKLMKDIIGGYAWRHGGCV